MLKGHYDSARGKIEYGNAQSLFPVEELDATVLQHRDAQLALNDVSEDDVISIVPTSFATSVALTQRPLTAIRVDSLSGITKAEIAQGVEAPLETFEWIQVGKWIADSPNHSLSEFVSGETTSP